MSGLVIMYNYSRGVDIGIMNCEEYEDNMLMM